MERRIAPQQKIKQNQEKTQEKEQGIKNNNTHQAS